ncbi:PREDICTED: peptidyl-tRNA hydrolase 2, mitochondrial isoform X2 [Nicotiana attenuata]|uniref:peptidyl-tRNA hydrolase 2, mitochondrial isoform X2 n=1 Tax=Nicotiana attenuata TaxID=49451 RepID=UPI000904FE60|nr:PREDICTED: peptidyl-tRNA hydrolase 2, mitochondrial isoform X2 [Nicotiana attenuata]
MIDMAWLSAIILGAGCLALGYIIGVRHSSRTSLSNKASGDTETLIDGKKKKGVKPPLEVERLAEILEDFKMVLVVRNDLKMGKGKIAAQCRWEMCGQVKVVVKIEREEDMLLLQERAKSLNIPTHITIDAGRTQIAPNSRTVMAVLGPADLVDDITGGLKLL